MGRFLIWLSGAESSVLRRCPGDRAKYIGIGSAILITSALAATSMSFALDTALKAPLPVAIAFALAWGLAIMSLDRWLVVSLQRQDSRTRYAILALTRLTLAVLFGFIISTPFVLQIFRPEIQNELDKLHAQAATQFAAHLPLAGQIANEDAKIASLEALITTGGKTQNPYQNPVVVGLINQRTAAQKQQTRDFDQWQCQLYGLRAGGVHCRPGNGPLAAAAHQRYLNDVAQVRQLNQQIKSEIATLNNQVNSGHAATIATARAQLAAAKQALATDVATQQRLKTTFYNSNKNNGGLLIRLRALSDITSGNSTLAWARWLLFALFTTIECLPVLVKVLLNIGPENTYEKALTSEEQMWLRLSEEASKRRMQAGNIEADAVLTEAQQLAAERDPMIQEISRLAVDAERRVALAWIKKWENDQMRALGNVGGGTSEPSWALVGATSGTGPRQHGPVRPTRSNGADQSGQRDQASGNVPTEPNRPDRLYREGEPEAGESPIGQGSGDRLPLNGQIGHWPTVDAGYDQGPLPDDEGPLPDDQDPPPQEIPFWD